MRERFNREADATEHRIFLCEDIVSRKSILDKFAECADNTRSYSDVWEYVKTMQPVLAIKVGEWKRIGYDIYECSKCGQNVQTLDICAYKYCHGCGIKMKEVSE